MSRHVEVRPLPAPVLVHGEPIRFADLRIGGTTVQLTEEEARAVGVALAGRFGGWDLREYHDSADLCRCRHLRGDHWPECDDRRDCTCQGFALAD